MSNLTKNPVFQLIVALFAIVGFVTAGALAIITQSMAEVVTAQGDTIVELESELSTVQHRLDELDALAADVDYLTSLAETNADNVVILTEGLAAVEDQLASQNASFELPDLGEIDLSDILNP